MVVHATADKAHLALSYSVWDERQARLGARAPWIVTRQDGRWGVQARSGMVG